MTDQKRQLALERAARQARQESRAIREEIEAAEGEVEDARRTLGDVLIDLGRRGTPVRIETAVDVIAGAITHVGSDLVVVRTQAGARVDIALQYVVGVRAEAGRVAATAVTTGHPHSMIARLRELDELVEIQRSAHASVRGFVSSVSADHCCLSSERPGGAGTRIGARTSTEVFIPVAAVVWVRTAV